MHSILSDQLEHSCILLSFLNKSCPILLFQGIYGTTVVFDVFKLQGGVIHNVMVEGQMVGSAKGYASLEFLTNSPPYGGSCNTSRWEGKYITN